VKKKRQTDITLMGGCVWIRGSLRDSMLTDEWNNDYGVLSCILDAGRFCYCRLKVVFLEKK
jgi:hypothetical protein